MNAESDTTLVSARKKVTENLHTDLPKEEQTVKAIGVVPHLEQQDDGYHGPEEGNQSPPDSLAAAESQQSGGCCRRRPLCSSRLRLWLSWSFLIIGVIVVPVALTGWYVRQVLAHTPAWLSMTGPMANDPIILDAMVSKFSSKLLNATLSLSETIGVDAGLCPPCIGVSQLIKLAVWQIVRSSLFQTAWIEANTLAHKIFVAILTGRADRLEKAAIIASGMGSGVLNLNLSSIAQSVSTKLEERGFRNGSLLVRAVDWVAPLANSTTLKSSQDAFNAAMKATEAVIALGVLLFVIALVLAPNRWQGAERGLLAVAFGSAIIAILCGIIYIAEVDFLHSSLGTAASMRIQYWLLLPLSRTAATLYLVMAGVYLLLVVFGYPLLSRYVMAKKSSEEAALQSEADRLSSLGHRNERQPWLVRLSKHAFEFAITGVLILGAVLVLLSPPTKEQFERLLEALACYLALILILVIAGRVWPSVVAWWRKRKQEEKSQEEEAKVDGEGGKGPFMSFAEDKENEAVLRSSQDRDQNRADRTKLNNPENQGDAVALMSL